MMAEALRPQAPLLMLNESFCAHCTLWSGHSHSLISRLISLVVKSAAGFAAATATPISTSRAPFILSVCLWRRSEL